MLNNHIEDIKYMFDAIRNIALCVALTVGLPFVAEATPQIFGSNIAKIITVSFIFGMILGLYVLNLYWLHVKLENKNSSKGFHFISFFIVIFILSITIGGAAFIEVWQKLASYV